ncbi:MAG: SRPBCC family protein [Schleiferiaceae bacterium]|jgi:ligand-binding SRPBCC domain-containing protein
MYRIERTQVLPISLEEAWAFFSSPKNLAKITPKELGFVVHGNVPEVMYPGLFIEYTVSPLLGIPMRWVTEITHVREGSYFVDEQRVGPYAIWHHEHFFESVPGGVKMTDVVHYKVPLGILGNLVHPWLVRPKLEQIFSYRWAANERMFGTL